MVSEEASGLNGTAVALVTVAKRTAVVRTREGMCIVSGWE